MAHGGPAPRAGDIALAAALSFHNMVMSGGVDHALDMLTPEQLTAAAAGYRYLQLDDVAELVGQARSALAGEDDDRLAELDARYNDLTPRDQTLGDQFAAALQKRPHDFAPVT
jgi:hypothetical protein